MAFAERRSRPDGNSVCVLVCTAQEEQLIGRQKVALLVLASVIGGAGLVLVGKPLTDGSKDKVVAAGIPDPADVRGIQAAIWRAYELYDVAGRTYETSAFAEVFVDDSRVPLTRDQRDRLEEWFGPVRGDAGYLTYVTGCYTHGAESDRLFQEAWAKAIAEGRDHLLPQDYLTPEEWKAIQESNAPIPPPPPSPPRFSMSAEEVADWIRENTRFDSLVVNDDMAVVVFDDGATQNEATLVRKANRWYIAGVERLAVTGP
jgi:hypothetical protein